MEGLLYFYGLAIVGLFIGGIVTIIIKASKKEPVKVGIMMLIASVALVVIGAGACAFLLYSS